MMMMRMSMIQVQGKGEREAPNEEGWQPASEIITKIYFYKRALKRYIARKMKN